MVSFAMLFYKHSNIKQQQKRKRDRLFGLIGVDLTLFLIIFFFCYCRFFFFISIDSEVYYKNGI